MKERIVRKLTSLLYTLFPRMGRDRQLLDHVREYIVPVPPADPDAVVNMPVTMLNVPGLDFHEGEQLARVSSFQSKRHQALFDALRRDPAINRFLLGKPGISNTYCNTPDAEIYGSMILDRKPRRVVEVGSGFSTLVARKTIDHAGYDTKVVVIDPYPRTDVRAAADELTLSRVEQTDLVNGWSKDDLLFIDSSHICRTRGDLPYLFCRVIPSLPPGVLVHVHDIFLPYDYPNVYDQWCHTEEYLLACMLAFSRRYRIVLATHWLSRTHPAQMNAAFGPFSGTEAMAPHHFGCSFWFEVTA